MASSTLKKRKRGADESDEVVLQISDHHEKVGPVLGERTSRLHNLLLSDAMNKSSQFSCVAASKVHPVPHLYEKEPFRCIQLKRCHSRRRD